MACGKNLIVHDKLIAHMTNFLIFNHNVEVEPELLPVKSAEFKVIEKNTERARLDIAANGLWGPFQKTMFDVRIFHPNCKSYKNKSMKSSSTRCMKIRRSKTTNTVFSRQRKLASLPLFIVQMEG